jgi:hypothetical protein
MRGSGFDCSREITRCFNVSSMVQKKRGGVTGAEPLLRGERRNRVRRGGETSPPELSSDSRVHVPGRRQVVLPERFPQAAVAYRDINAPRLQD